MTEQDLIHYCRYYKGENECPYSDNSKSMLWDTERSWVFDSIAIISSTGEGDFGTELNEYLAYGLENFKNMDETPITLKARLFNRYAKTAYSMRDAVEPFKNFYRKYY